MNNDTNNSIYTEEEAEVLKLTKKVRLDVVNNMIKEGVPERVGDIRVLNEVLGDLDKQAVDSANARLKHSDNQNKEAVMETVAAALAEISRNKTPVLERTIVADADIIPMDIVPGETDIGVSQLNPSDFIQNEED